jgi:hypothetical protein
MTAKIPGPAPASLADAVAEQLKLKRDIPIAQRLDAFRAAGERYLADAQRVENSEATRVDCACDAAYMFCRVILAGADEYLAHPSELVFWTAAEQLGWPKQAVAGAVKQMFDRYAAPGEGQPEGRRYDALVALAQRLRDAPANSFSW